MDNYRIFFFGDSICFGQGVSPNKSWVVRIAATLEATFPQAIITVQNPSINGNTTRMALERMPYDVQAHRPDVLIVQFGMNDCNVWATDLGHQRVSPDAFVANLNEIIDRARLNGVRELLLGANHPTTRTTAVLSHTDITYEDSNRRYNALIRQVAKSKRCQLIDMEQVVLQAVKDGRAPADFVLDDQLHLSSVGHDIYFSTYAPAIIAAVRRLMSS
jgi:lysophospholipase L1-like esterase